MMYVGFYIYSLFGSLCVEFASILVFLEIWKMNITLMIITISEILVDDFLRWPLSHLPDAGDNKLSLRFRAVQICCARNNISKADG